MMRCMLLLALAAVVGCSAASNYFQEVSYQNEDCSGFVISITLGNYTSCTSSGCQYNPATGQELGFGFTVVCGLSGYPAPVPTTTNAYVNISNYASDTCDSNSWLSATLFNTGVCWGAEGSFTIYTCPTASTPTVYNCLDSECKQCPNSTVIGGCNSGASASCVSYDIISSASVPSLSTITLLFGLFIFLTTWLK